MTEVNYNFLEKELLESMLENLKNEDKNKDIICEQISILASFGIINAEQLRQLSYFKHYNDYRCYATYLYSEAKNGHHSDLIDARCKAFAEALIQLEKQENFLARTSFSEADFKSAAPIDRDRSDDESIIFKLSYDLIYSIESYFISKEFIDDNCIVSRKKAINTVRKKLLHQISLVTESELSNRAYRYSFRKFEHHFAQNDNVIDNIKLFLYRSIETSIYQQFIDVILNNSIEDTEFNRAKLQEMVQVLVVLQRINTAQTIQLCAHSLDKPDYLPISLLSLEAAMGTSFNIELEITHMEDQECNQEFSLDDFEAAASQNIDQAHELGFYEFAFGLLENNFSEMLDFTRAHKETLDFAAYHRLLTLLLARKLSFKDYVALKLEFGF